MRIFYRRLHVYGLILAALVAPYSGSVLAEGALKNLKTYLGLAKRIDD